MTRDAGGDGSGLRLVARALQVGLVGLVAYGVAVGSPALVANASLALGITLLPVLIEWRYGHRIDDRLVVWITIAAAVHAAGSLGPYDVQSGPLAWYDQAAHAISASFVAGVGYALVVALDRHSTRIQFPDSFRVVFTLCLILAFGVAWEIVEFAVGGLGELLGGGEALVQYGMDDTVLDLVFNTLAAALVALWGTEYFGGIAALVNGRLSRSGRP